VSRPDVPVLISVVHIAVLVATMFYFVPPLGAEGAALSHLCANMASLPLSFVLVQRVLGVPLSSAVKVVWRPVVGSTAMFFVVGWLIPDAAAVSPPLAWLTVRLLETIGLGALVYTACVLSLWFCAGRPDSAERMILGFVRETHRRLVRAR
jgi:peptidoglycan biosynthesis protein MviN/MurJ (putative lipid II flippase)